MLFCMAEPGARVAVAILALLAVGCSDGEQASVSQGPGLKSSEQTPSGVQGHSTVVVNSTVLNSSASLYLKTYQQDGVVVRSLGYHTKLDSVELWFSLSPFPEGTTEALMPDLAVGALLENGTSWSFASGVATVTQDGEAWAVRLAGIVVAADQNTKELSLDVSGKVERQCLVPDESAPRAESQDGSESSPELVVDPEWSSAFCQGQRQ